MLIPMSEDVREANTARIQAEQRLKQLTNHQQDGGFSLAMDDARVLDQQRLVDKLTAEAKRIKDLYEVRGAAWNEAGYTLQAVEGWLRDGRPARTVLEDFDGPEPTLSKGETVVDAIERLRRRGRDLKADLHRIRSAPYPSAHARAKVRQEIEALAMRGAPSVSDVIEHDRSVIWPTQNIRSQVYNTEVPSVAFAELPDTLALFAWLHRDGLIAALDREITSEADDKAALSHEARGKAEAEVMGDLLSVEREEAELTWLAQSQGLPVEHRADTSPIAVLGLKLVAVTNGHAEPSSWMHAWDIVRGGR